MPDCPTCGRRYRPRRHSTPATPLPLFDWNPPDPSPRRPAGLPVRVLLLHGCRDAEGEPRPALLIPGRSLPVAFPTLAAALDAKRAMETGQ